MSLRKRYSRKDNDSLIAILENPAGYTQEALDVASEELESRKLDSEFLLESARAIQKKQLIHLLQTFDPLNDKLELPKSYFFSPKEMKAMLIEEFDTFIKEKEGFRFDVWKYAIGAIG